MEFWTTVRKWGQHLKPFYAVNISRDKSEFRHLDHVTDPNSKEYLKFSDFNNLLPLILKLSTHQFFSVQIDVYCLQCLAYSIADSAGSNPKNPNHEYPELRQRELRTFQTLGQDKLRMRAKRASEFL